MRHDDYLYLVPRFERASYRNKNVSVVLPLVSKRLPIPGDSTDGILDKLIVYAINRGALTR
jgi:hypothetical protein